MTSPPPALPLITISVHQLFVLEVPADPELAKGVQARVDSAYAHVERHTPRDISIHKRSANNKQSGHTDFSRHWTQLTLAECTGIDGVKAMSQAFEYNKTSVIQLMWEWKSIEADGLRAALEKVAWSPTKPAETGAQPAKSATLPKVSMPEHRLAVAVETERARQRATAQVLMKQLVADPDLVDTLQEVRMEGGTFFFSRESAAMRPWPAVLLFDSEEMESSPEVGRYLLQEWPVTVMYALRIANHSAPLVTESEVLRSQSTRMLNVLDPYLAGVNPPGTSQTTPGSGSAPRKRAREQARDSKILHAQSPEYLQKALNQIQEPKVALIRSTASVERKRMVIQNDLESLERHAHMLSHMRTTASSAGLGASSAEHLVLLDILSAAWSGGLRQIDANLKWAQHMLEEAASASTLLQTQADILEAQFERKLAMGVGIVGVLLALGQIIDAQVTSVVYCTWLGAVWEALGLPQPGTLVPDRPLLWFRLTIIVVLWALFSMLVTQWVRGQRRRWLAIVILVLVVCGVLVVVNSYFGLFAWPASACLAALSQ